MNEIRMSFEEFAEVVRKEIEKKFPDCEIRITDVKKENVGFRKEITKCNKNSKICPNVYLDSYYDSFEKHNACLKSIIEEIENILKFDEEKNDVDLGWYTNIEIVKGKLRISAMNKDMNADMLKEIPHRIVGDIAFYLYVDVDMKDRGKGSIKVRNEHLKVWNKELEETWQYSVDDLFDYAIENMLNFGKVHMITMENALIGMLTNECLYDKRREGKPDLTNEDSCMYILTNADKCQGAGIAACRDILDMIASRIGDGYYMIPSSRHEWLIIRNYDGNIDDLTEIIDTANHESVDRCDWLSNSLYRYSVIGGLQVAKEGEPLE